MNTRPQPTVVGTWPRVRGLGFRFITDRKLRHFLLSLAITLVPPPPPPADVVNIAVNLNNYSCLLHAIADDSCAYNSRTEPKHRTKCLDINHASASRIIREDKWRINWLRMLQMWHRKTCNASYFRKCSQVRKQQKLANVKYTMCRKIPLIFFLITSSIVHRSKRRLARWYLRKRATESPLHPVLWIPYLV